MERTYAEQKCKGCGTVIGKGEGVVFVAYGDTPSPFPSMASAHGAMAPTGEGVIRFTPREEWYHVKCFRSLTSGGSSPSSGGRA